MLKKSFLAIMLFAFIVSVSGCCALGRGAEGFVEGAKEDWAWACKTAKQSDGWVKDNLW